MENLNYNCNFNLIRSMEAEIMLEIANSYYARYMSKKRLSVTLARKLPSDVYPTVSSCRLCLV